MTESRLRLAPDVVPEPLVLGWYAWPHLVSPATCAMNVANRHLKIMDSYLQAPQVHAAAARNPRLRGGPFMTYARDRSDEVRALRERTLQVQAPQLRFAAAVAELHALLLAEADGHALGPLYPRVPEPLRGYVELHYDLQGQPSFRFIEPLLYGSPCYDPGTQSLALARRATDARPFVLSTPRLPGDEDLELRLPFASPALDRLFRMRDAADVPEAVAEELGLDASGARALRALCGEAPAAPAARYTGDGVRTRYFGHACVLVETRDVALLTDPVVSYAAPGGTPRYTWADLPERLDAVLLTHNHQDHVLLETLLQLRPRIERLVVPRSGGGQLQDPSLETLFRRLGFRNVVALSEFDTLDLPGCRVTAVPFLGEHSDLSIATKLCYHVACDPVRLLFAVDSCNLEPRLYEHVRRELGPVDVLYLGMECDGAPLGWLYGPLLTTPLARDKDHSRRLAGSDRAQALGLVEAFSPREVYVYAMGQEPWLEFVMALKYTDEANPIVASNGLMTDCRARGLTAERLFGWKESLYR